VELGAGEDDTRRLVHEPIDELVAQRADVLVLGCTHFPFLLDYVRARVGPDLHVLETARPFAGELARRIMARGQVRQSGAGSLRIMTSGDPAVVQSRVDRLMPGAGSVQRLPERYC
jgi:glutamate racemase